MKSIIYLLTFVLSIQFAVAANSVSAPKLSDLTRELPYLLEDTSKKYALWNPMLSLDKSSIKVTPNTSIMFDLIQQSFDLPPMYEYLFSVNYIDNETGHSYLLQCKILVEQRKNKEFVVSILGKSIFNNENFCFLSSQEDPEDKMVVFDAIFSNPVRKLSISQEI